jgi:hypothetical protein
MASAGHLLYVSQEPNELVFLSDQPAIPRHHQRYDVSPRLYASHWYVTTIDHRNEHIVDPPPHRYFALGVITVHSQFYQSQIHLSMFGFECQSNSSSGQLAIINGAHSSILCASSCNHQPLCRYFDYDTSMKVCLVFKDGSLVASSSATSRVGSVRYMPDLYTSYAQPCAWNNCEINRYMLCNAFSRCQCPTGLVWNVQISVGESSLRSVSICHQNYSDSRLMIVLACSHRKLLVSVEYRRRHGSWNRW